MRIAELAAFHVRIPLRKTIRHASHTRDRNETLIVRCRLQDGTEGWGEGLPRPYVTGETIESAWEQFRTTNLRQQLGAAFDDLPGVLPLCNELKLNGRPANARDCFGNAVRCAIELSILDAVARWQRTPLSTVTQLVPEASEFRHNAERVRYSGAVTAMGAAQQVVTAAKLRLFGFHQCKVKVGMQGADDRAALRRIRRTVGSKVDLRIDANEAWTCADLAAKLQPLLPYGISAVEQPVPHASVDGLAAVRKQIETPIMLDESLCSLSDAERAIETQTCDLFNIRLSKCGGYLNSLRLAALAHRAGLGYQLGCQVGETGILSAAGRHVACSVAGIRYLEGSYDRFLVREPLTKEDLTFSWRGYAPALTKPGLGVEIDREAVGRVTVAEEHQPID